MKVQIHSKLEVDTVGPAGESIRHLAVTYSTERWAPRTVFLPLDQTDDASVAAAIRKDVDSLVAQPPQILEL